MTNVFASKIVRLAGIAILACILATAVGAVDQPRISEPKTMVLYFDMESANLTSEAKTIVLSAVDVAKREHANSIELAVYAAPDESARDRQLVARRAATIQRLIADYGFEGAVVVDDEAPDISLASVGDEMIDRRAVIRVVD
jgi:outer membrane protein OmpA-like peptidoglycan-associated protein